MMGGHQLERRAVMTAQHAAQLSQQSQARWRQARHTGHHAWRCAGCSSGGKRRRTQRKSLRWRASGWRSRRGNAAVLLLLRLLLADLVPRMRLLVGRRCLMLGPVKLLLSLLGRRAVRMFRTAGYGAGAAAVIRSAIHRSVIHRPSLRRRPRSLRSFFLSSLFLPLLSFSFSTSSSTCASSSFLYPISLLVLYRSFLSPRGQTRATRAVTAPVNACYRIDFFLFSSGRRSF